MIDSMKQASISIRCQDNLIDLQAQSGNITPIQYDRCLQGVESDSNILRQASRKFSNFVKNRKTKKIISKLKKERGRNHTIQYDKKFEFKEQWQFTDKIDYTLNYNYLFPQILIFRIFNAIMLFLFIFQIWLLSIFRLFQYKDNIWVFDYSLIINMLDIFLKGFFIYWFLSDTKIRNQHKKKEFMPYFEQFLGNIFTSVYSVLGITQVISDTENQCFLVLDFACIVILYLRCQEIYRNFKILIICSKYKPYMKIYDLMSNLFLLTHLFSLVIYGVSRFQPSQSFLTIIQSKKYMDWFDRYIYSIYFSSTTMLTVGYGDLLPSNVQQIIVVLIMQLFGIVMIGYINGQVGDVLCKLRKQRESLENDLTNTQKLSKSFDLNHQTTQKIKQYLINNRKLDEELNIQQQNTLLSKISDQLRNQANHTNQVNIIKQSLLFVYNFSKKTQLQVSLKLSKVIFSPNQTLPQVMGRQKIYLISKGEIAIFLTKNNKKGDSGRKILRILSKCNSHDFHENSFGHTALVLGRPTQLKAFSKDFAICHTIERHDLIEALGLDSNDLERFHEMRAKYQTCKHPQKQQCPQFHSIREHYSPNPDFIIKRHLKKKSHSKRRLWTRFREKSKTVIEDFQGMLDDLDVSSNNFSSEVSTIDPERIIYEGILTQRQRQNKYKNAGSMTMSISNIRTRNYMARYMNKKYQQKRQDLVKKFRAQQLSEPFEVIKQYNLFFKHANIGHILKKGVLSYSILHIANPVVEMIPRFYNNDSKQYSSRIEPLVLRQRRRLKTMIF